MTLSVAASMSLCTVRLECNGPLGTQVGTGFIYEFKVPTADNANAVVHMIVTNKHVAAKAESVQFTLSWRRHGVNVAEGVQEADDLHGTQTIIGLQDRLFPHPDPNVDLCGFWIDDVLGRTVGDLTLRAISIKSNWHIQPEEVPSVRAIESVVMVGYPNGLWDEVNNRPIARRGMTASHPLQSWNGKRQFVIDAACFPGSSGSPVFLYDDGVYHGVDDQFHIGSRARLVGVLFAGPVFTSDGRLEQRLIPTGAKTVPVLDQMMGLGFVIHADAILDLRAVLLERLTQQGHQIVGGLAKEYG